MPRLVMPPAISISVEEWKSRCLFATGSVFADGDLWTPANLENMDKYFVRGPDAGEGDFLAKLRGQLSNAPSETNRLAAEMLWFMYLFTSDMSGDTKRLHIRTVWAWSGQDLAPRNADLESALDQSIGSTGTAYQTHRWRELAFLVALMRAFKTLTPEALKLLVKDPWKLAEWIDNQPESKGRQLRHVILHLLHPNDFERISSGRSKREIVSHLLKKHLPGRAPIDLNNRLEVDRSLTDIRKEIEKKNGSSIDFYDPEIRQQWGEKSEAGNGGSPLGQVDADKEWCRARFGDAGIWAVACGAGGLLWPDFLKKGQIAIGWSDLGDLSEYANKGDIKEALRAGDPNNNNPRMDALACYEFSHEMKVGAVIIAKTGRDTLLGWGKVTSDYRHDASSPDYPNIRNVKWENTGRWKLADGQLITNKTLTDFRSYHSWLRYAFGIMDGAASPPPEPAALEYSVNQALTGLFLTPEQLVEIRETLGRKRNLILEGPPGVGKTFMARRLARLVTNANDNSRILSVQFHQNYSYEDFVQGWRPGPSGSFVRRDGVFLEFCKQAAADFDKPYVLLIDEINRANLSKVFGEVLVLLEADKRGPEHALRLSYGTKDEPPFFIPENLYVIGMMNTADRSLAMVDYALRRRFAFYPIRPAFSTETFAAYLKECEVDEGLIRKIVDRFTALNKSVRDDGANLGTGYEIGHSYFCPGQSDENLDETWYRRIVDTEIKPLLKEYWFDQPEKCDAAVQELLRP